jgi:hypothetical protein
MTNTKWLMLAAVLAVWHSPAPAQAPTADEAVKLGVEAYVYAYPLVTMEYTRRVMTNVESVQGTRGPMGRFVNLREYPSAAFRDVTAPNADTLYSTAWLDVSREPYILRNCAKLTCRIVVSTTGMDFVVPFPVE